MSRIGKKPITLPKGVTVKIDDGAVEVQGPKGKLRQAVPPGILFAKDGEALVARLERADDSSHIHARHPFGRCEGAQRVCPG